MTNLKTVFAATLLVGSAPFLSSCAPAGAGQPGAAALTPEQSETLDKQLAGKVAGPAVSCINDARSYSSIRVSDDIILYRASGNLVYRNDLRGGCPGLASDNDIIVIRKTGSQTCRGDFFHLVDQASGIQGPTCVFGEFVPYRKPAGGAG